MDGSFLALLVFDAAAMALVNLSSKALGFL
jgi:hypothetical protein